MITFLGEIRGGSIRATVLIFGEPRGHVLCSLDEWQRLREDDRDDSPIWATTPEEYKTATGESFPGAERTQA